MVRLKEKKKMIFVFLSAFVCLCFSVSCLLFRQYSTKYHDNSNLYSVTQLTKKKQSVVIYLAKNSCSDCKKVDKELKKKRHQLNYPVYRIEVTEEKNKEQLNQLIEQNDVTTVPTFLLVSPKNVAKIEKNTLVNEQPKEIKSSTN